MGGRGHAGLREGWAREPWPDRQTEGGVGGGRTKSCKAVPSPGRHTPGRLPPKIPLPHTNQAGSRSRWGVTKTHITNSPFSPKEARLPTRSSPPRRDFRTCHLKTLREGERPQDRGSIACDLL